MARVLQRVLCMRHAWIAVVALCACNPTQKTAITEEAFENPETRREMLEATLRVMDAHPEYVDEMFALTLKHPPTLERFLENTAKNLDDPKLARRTGEHLARNPAGLQSVMIATLDASDDRKAARQAIVNAVEARAPLAAAILVERPKQLGTVFRAIVQKAISRSDTKELMTEMMEQAL